MANVMFKYGARTAYDALGTKDANTLYFLDSGELMKGDAPYSQGYEVINGNSTDNAPANPSKGRLYIFTPGMEVCYWNGAALVSLISGVASSIDASAGANENKLVTAAAVRAHVAAEVAKIEAGELDTRITALEGSVGTLTTDLDAAEANITTLQSGKADKATTLAGYGITDAYTKVEVDAKVTGVYHFKGTKATKVELEAVQDKAIGDVYNVTEDGQNYAWVIDTEHAEGFWDGLGGIFDASALATKAELTAHTGDADIHVTSAKKAEWDAKATTTYVDTAKAAAIQEAKTYADGLNTAMDARVDALEAVDVADKVYADQAEADAISAAKTYSDSLNTAMNTRVAAIEEIDIADKAYADQAETDAINAAKTYTDSALAWNTIA